MGRIRIEDLRVSAIIGTLPEERLSPQTLWITIDVDADTQTPAATDDLTAALDYRDLATAVTDLAVGGRFALVETLAERAALTLQSRFAVGRVSVSVRKPAAIPAAEAVIVKVTRDSPPDVGSADR